MTKILNFEIITTLLISALCFVLSETVQNILGGLLVLSVGIVHGANDIEILKKQSAATSRLNYSLYYILVVMAGVFAFFFLPAIALLCFVVFSAFHFGEQHWENRVKPTEHSTFFYFCYGALIFSLLFFFHQQSVQEVVFTITAFYLPSPIFLGLVSISTVLTLSTGYLLSSVRSLLFLEILLLLLLALLFATSTLILAFGFYFAVWHSFPSLKSQFSYLYTKQSIMGNIKSYLKESYLYWGAAILGLTGVYIWVDFAENYVLPLFFSFLAAITFPHVFVMHWMFQSKKNKSSS